jgi:hypothetical protein
MSPPDLIQVSFCPSREKNSSDSPFLVDPHYPSRRSRTYAETTRPNITMDIDHNFIGLNILRKQVSRSVKIPFSNSPYRHDEG